MSVGAQIDGTHCHANMARKAMLKKRRRLRTSSESLRCSLPVSCLQRSRTHVSKSVCMTSVPGQSIAVGLTSKS